MKYVFMAVVAASCVMLGACFSFPPARDAGLSNLSEEELGSLSIDELTGMIEKEPRNGALYNMQAIKYEQEERYSEALSIDIFFAHPYHPWERGLNERTNGLIRQYLPKKVSFAPLTQKQLDKIVDKINNRPRKVLGYLTPCEVFSA
jgi:transposase InsO family protein